MKEKPLSKEAMLYESLPDGKVKCQLCGRRCIITEGNSGLCEARKNEEGKLFSLSYARACAIAADPIEKKPLFHFNPGSQVLSVSSPFCNFFCRFCDNWIISQQRTDGQTEDMPPQKVVDTAKAMHCKGISYTYTEPTTFYEWAYDTSKLAHEAGLFNTFVTNGYLTPEAVQTIAPYLDAATVDFKGAGDPEFYRNVMRVPTPQPIYDCLKAMKKNSIHIELTNLIVPKYGDSEQKLKELIAWIKDNLGEDTPLHFLRFSPSFHLTDVPPTPVEAIEKAYKLATDAGLRYVYTGNIPGHDGENTHCPNCHELLIERYIFSISKWNLKDDMTCPKCGTKIAIKGKLGG